MPRDTIVSVCARSHDGERLLEDRVVCHVGALPGDHEKVAMTVRVTPSRCHRSHGGRTSRSERGDGLQMPPPAGFEQAHGWTYYNAPGGVTAGRSTTEPPL